MQTTFIYGLECPLTKQKIRIKALEREKKKRELKKSQSIKKD